MSNWLLALCGLVMLLLSGAGSIARALPQITLSYPACFPVCSADDQRRLLLDGDAERPVLTALAEAERDIRFSIYTFSRRPIFDAMIAAQADRGVRIRGLVDRAQVENLESYCHEQVCDFQSLLPDINVEPMPLRERMALFAPLTIYQQSSLVGKLLMLSWKHEAEIAIRVGQGRSRLMHNKFLIVDDRIVQTSSGNWSSTAMSVNFENRLEYRVPEDVSAISAFACAFEAIWGRNGGGSAEQLTQCGLKNQIYFTPANSSPEHIETRVLDAINQTKATIDISMHHLAHPGVYDALVGASDRGVMIRLLFDDDDCPNRLSDDLNRLLRAHPSQVTVRYLPTQCKINQLSHNRFGVFDGNLLINGSANWSLAGLRSNYETFQIYENTAVVGTFAEQFERMFAAGLNKSECRCRLSEVTCRERYCRGEFNPF